MVKTSLSVSKVFLAQRDQMFHWFTVCFGGGIGVYFLLPRDLSWFEICVLGLCCAVVLLLIASLPVISQMCATLLLAFLLGICAAGVRTLSVAAPILGWPYYGDVQGRIVAVDRSANDALRITLEQVSLGNVSPDQINEQMIDGFLYTHGAPDPDLLIRTSGEMRLSNFLLWQLAYSEFIFMDCLWPDFGKEQLADAIEAYCTRNRRVGGLVRETGS